MGFALIQSHIKEEIMPHISLCQDGDKCSRKLKCLRYKMITKPYQPYSKFYDNGMCDAFIPINNEKVSDRY